MTRVCTFVTKPKVFSESFKDHKKKCQELIQTGETTFIYTDSLVLRYSCLLGGFAVQYFMGTNSYLAKLIY